MVTLEKIAHLAEECRFDSLGPAQSPAVVDVDAKMLRTLGEGTRHDVCASTFSPRETPLPGICHAFTKDGRCVSLFKTLYTNHCTHQCSYCTNAANCSNKSKAFSYTPEELAKITLSLYRSNYIEGLFLSSGAGRDEDRVTERMVETVRLLRQKYAFSGYIHLKVLPGSARSHIQEAIELADRVSINLEAASASHMSEMCATKSYENDILQRQRYIRDILSDSAKNSKAILPAGQTTQLVVGATGESDEEIFKRVLYEYKDIGVRGPTTALFPLSGAHHLRIKRPSRSGESTASTRWTGSIGSITLSPARFAMPLTRMVFLAMPIPRWPSPGSLWINHWTQIRPHSGNC